MTVKFNSTGEARNMSSKRNKNKTQKPKVCSVEGQRSQTSYKSHSVCITKS